MANNNNDKLREEYVCQLLKLTQKTSLHAEITTSHEYRVIRKRIGRVIFGYRISGPRGIVELVIECGKGKEKENIELFDQLTAKKDEIEFEGDLEWDRSDGKQSCRIKKTYSSGGCLEEKKDWHSNQNEMIDAMSRLHKAFRPHIEELKHT